MYKVIHAFHDLADNEHYYEVGDTYPHAGAPDMARVQVLMTDANMQCKPLIEEEKAEEKPAKKAEKPAEEKPAEKKPAEKKVKAKKEKE